MSKYTKARVNKICKLIASDDYTIPEICLQVGINPATYHQWKLDHPDFPDAIKKAQDERLEVFRKAARSGLLTLLQGKEYEETTTEYVEGKPDAQGNTKPKIKLQKKTKKVILPNPTSVIFALKNLDEDNFRDIIRQVHTGDEEGGPIKTETTVHTNVDYAKLTNEVLEAIQQARIKIQN